jgi:hypothetical protein
MKYMPQILRYHNERSCCKFQFVFYSYVANSTFACKYIPGCVFAVMMRKNWDLLQLTYVMKLHLHGREEVKGQCNT